jgi:dolichol-phosphate mannosyltransferase
VQQQRAVVLPPALRQTRNWMQLARFGLVGTSGYFVNLAIFGALLHLALVGYRFAAAVAYGLGVANNFLWNRAWTFAARDGHAGWQAARFVLVSVGAFALSLAVLVALVEGVGLAKMEAQVLAVMSATPLSFLGNKLWAFR